MPKLKPNTIIPTAEENAIITAAAKSDPDSLPYTDAQWEAVKPTVKRGRPPQAITKSRISIRLSPDVIKGFRDMGPGWQTRMNAALKSWLTTHKPSDGQKPAPRKSAAAHSKRR